MKPIVQIPIADSDVSGKKGNIIPPTVQPERAVSAAEALQNITNLVLRDASAIGARLLQAAMDGQVPSARYLFEMAGIYPKREETTATQHEESLTYRLLREFGLPAEPSVCSNVETAQSERKIAELAGEDASGGADGRFTKSQTPRASTAIKG